MPIIAFFHWPSWFFQKRKQDFASQDTQKQEKNDSLAVSPQTKFIVFGVIQKYLLICILNTGYKVVKSGVQKYFALEIGRKSDARNQP